MKKYLELRYRLLPYTYTIARECCDTGLPMMRALWLHHARRCRRRWRAAISSCGAATCWCRRWSRRAPPRAVSICRAARGSISGPKQGVEGGREIDRAVDLETMPLHVRAGAIIPMGPMKQYVDEPVDAPLTVTIYPGADGAFELYEDDGKTFAHKKGDWMRLAMTWNDARAAIQHGPGSRVADASAAA